jgi:hypothetical protein
MSGGGTEIVATATLFAMLVTKTVDLVRNAIDPQARLPKLVWNLTALGLGVAAALIWKINMLDNYSTTAIQGFSGQFFTGLAIGGASSGWHELFDLLSGTAKRAKFGGDPSALERGPAKTVT